MPKKQFFQSSNTTTALCAGHAPPPNLSNGWRYNATDQTCDWRVDEIGYGGCPGCAALNGSTCECDMGFLTSGEKVRQVPGTYFCEIYADSFAVRESECGALWGGGELCRDTSGNVVDCTSSAARWKFSVPHWQHGGPSVGANGYAGIFGGCVYSFSYGWWAGSFVGWYAQQTWQGFACPTGLENTSWPASGAGSYMGVLRRGVDADGNPTNYQGTYLRTLDPIVSDRIAGESGYYTIQSYGGPSGVVAETAYGCYWDGSDELSWSGLATNVLGGSQYYSDGVCKGVVNPPACTSGYTFHSSYPPLSGTYSGPVCVSEYEQYLVGTWASSCRGPYGRLYSAYGSAAPSGTASISVVIYNDSLPEGVASSRGIDTGAASKTGSPSITCRSSGILDLVYLKYNTAAPGSPYQLRYVYSRDSGRTWAPLKSGGAFNAVTDATATTVSGTVTLTPIELATGYERVVHHLDERTGRLVLLLWRNDAWYVRVATEEETDNWSVSDEHLVAAGDPTQASLQAEREGGYTFVFWDLDGVATHLRCRDLQSDGSGTWE